MAIYKYELRMAVALTAYQCIRIYGTDESCANQVCDRAIFKRFAGLRIVFVFLLFFVLFFNFILLYVGKV